MKTLQQSALQFAFCLLFSCCSLLAGCSTAIFSKSVAPELKQTLVSLTNNYLTAIIAGDEKSVLHSVYVADFFTDPRFTSDDFHRQFAAIQGRWTGADHPLVGLRVENVTADENTAEVRLKKDPKWIGKSGSQVIAVNFRWAGTGWVIKSDSLFGKDKLFAELLAKNG